jgi:Heterokaryon incompatibility protein (HET)
MRLLNSTTLKLHEFIGSQIPPYAILSHTWGEEEVSFQELSAGTLVEKKGFEKIKRCCEIAAGDGFEYAWVDTCCIDKTSSAELSEAINSMFRWYKEAEVCYAFLSDVPSDEEPELLHSAFRKSRWFSRGWTLQELIAPVHVLFLSRDWKEIDTKWNLQTLLSKITSIHTKALVGTEPLSSFSVAQKMSWVSKRETTRDEDIAYCMMGIFDINMPMLYGEGKKAFTRLQEQILANFDDDSIFAWWTTQSRELLSPEFLPMASGLLARSPKLFSRSGNVVRAFGMRWTTKVSLIGGHIRLEAPTFKTTSPPNSTTTYKVAIRCRIDDESWRGQKKYLAIQFEPEMLDQQQSSTELYVSRIRTSRIHAVQPWQSIDLDGPKMETMSVRKDSDYYGNWGKSKDSRELQFRCVRGQRRALVSLETYPLSLLDPWSSDKTLGLRIKDTDGLVFDVILSFRPHQQILTGCVLEQMGDESLEDVYCKFVYGQSQTQRFKDLQLAQSRMMPLLPEDYEGRTSDRVQHRHKNGAQSSVSIKKIRYREAIGPSNIEGNIFERVFFHYQGSFIEGSDKMVSHVDEKYLIELRLD